MNETQPNITETGLEEKRKNAMLRYIGVMFIVAFLFVLISMLGELRSSEATITQLNQSSSSAVQKAEQLQDHNRQLETDNAYLEGRIEELEKQLAEQDQDLLNNQRLIEDLRYQLTEALTAMDDSNDYAVEVKTAYVLLLQAAEDPSLLPQLEQYKQYFDATAHQFYENLTKEGE